MRRLAHKLMICLSVLCTSLFAVLLPIGSASASDGCTAGTSASGQHVYYCGVWLPSGGVPVYASTAAGSAVVDHLHTGGTANWFYCQVSGGTASASGYTSSDWARTVGDDHGATGYVPAVYFSGTENYWAGLPACGGSSSPPGSSCSAGTTHAGASVYYCPVWLPSGGVPLYSSTSGSSSVVDHLHTGGSANWFYCQLAGSSITVGGYTSSNWAKTVGDDNGATGYVPAVYFSGSQNYWAGLPACSSGTNPPPADGTCTAGTTGSGASVYYCPVWLPSGGVPLYSSTSGSSGVVDHLHTGGSANWFYCQLAGSSITVAGYTSSNWAKTVGDDNGATGYVPAVYFSGSQNYWPSLPKCGSGGTPPPGPPTSGGGSTSGTACSVSLTSIPQLTLAMLQAACAQENYIYAWDGGHAAAPGPTYGTCSPQNGAPNDCNVIGFDCSGLVRYAYYKATGVDALDGYTWSQWTEAQALHPKAVIAGAGSGGPSNVANAEGSLKPGDVIFYGTNANEHVALYLGGGKQINAYESGYHVGVTGVDTGITFWGAVRLW
jgi:cell wall-associated NlpC family hydrolase